MIRHWILPLVLLALLGGWAGWIHLTGRAYLPRHTSARDVPYSLAAPDVPPQPFNRVMTDPVNLILPDLVYLKRELERGRVPIWNHGLLGGVPHLANPIAGALYPPNWLVALFDPIDFLLVSACLHVFLGGMAFWLFLRSAGLGPHAALVGSLAFALSGWTSAHLHNTPLVAVAAWIPIGLAGVEWVLAGKRRRGALAIAGSASLQWLAGFPIFAVIGILTLGAYGAVRLALLPRTASIRERAGIAGRMLIAGVIGLLLAAPLIVPTLDLRGRAPRKGADRPVLLSETFQPGVLSGVALPFWLGDAHEKPITEPPIEADRDHAARHVAGALLLGRRVGAAPLQTAPINTFGERALYAGAPVLLLALVGAVLLRNRVVVALLVLAALATAFACGLLPPDPVLRLLGLNVGAPGRAIMVLALAVPALAAFGFDRLLDPSRKGSGAAAALRIAALVLGAGGVGACAAAFVAREACLGAIVAWLRESGAPAALGVAADRPDADYAGDLAPAFDRLVRDVLRLSSFVLGAWIALEWGRRATRGGPAGGLRITLILIPALLVADLGAFFLRTNRPVTREGLFPTTPALEFLRQGSASGRFARVSADADAAVAEMHAFLPPNMGMMHELSDVQGYRDLVQPGVLRLLEGTSAMVATGGASGVGLAQAASPVLDLLSARWLIASAPLDESTEAYRRSGLRRVEVGSQPGRDAVVYENPDALPLAYVAHDAVVMRDEDALAALKNGVTSPSARVIVDRLPTTSGPSPAGSNGGDSVVARHETDGIRVDATLSSPGYIVVGESWDPGWRARLWHGPWEEDKGPALEIVRANYAFMAVWVPRGQHTIQFRYWPRSLSIGIGCAAAALVALAGLLVWPTRTRRVDPEAANA